MIVEEARKLREDADALMTKATELEQLPLAVQQLGTQMTGIMQIIAAMVAAVESIADAVSSPRQLVRGSDGSYEMSLVKTSDVARPPEVANE